MAEINWGPIDSKSYSNWNWENRLSYKRFEQLSKCQFFHLTVGLGPSAETRVPEWCTKPPKYKFCHFKKVFKVDQVSPLHSLGTIMGVRHHPQYFGNLVVIPALQFRRSNPARLQLNRYSSFPKALLCLHFKVLF